MNRITTLGSQRGACAIEMFVITAELSRTAPASSSVSDSPPPRPFNEVFSRKFSQHQLPGTNSPVWLEGGTISALVPESVGGAIKAPGLAPINAPINRSVVKSFHS